MSSPQYSVVFSAPVAGTVTAGSVGDVLIPDATSGLYVKATTANRGTRRSTGIALSAYATGGVTDIQQYGQVDTVTAGLGAGTASWVRVSTTGSLERAAVSGSDDVVGWVETDGTFHAVFGYLTAAVVNGGGGGFTPPTGTGLVTVTGGVLNAAATTLPLSAASVVQATGTGIPHVVAGVLTAASSLIVNADVSAGAAIAASKVVQATGTGIPHVVAGALSAASSLIVDADVATGAAIAASKLAAAASDTFCQFNDAGVFNGTADFTFAKGSGTATIFNIVASNSLNVASSKLVADGSNIGLGGAISAGGGTLVVFIANASVVPSTNPTGGGVLYVQAGALKYRGSAGTITVIGPA